MARISMLFVLGIVLIPSCFSIENVVETARAANLTEFVSVLKEAIDQGLVDLSTGGPYTIFVPNNAAFAKLTPEDLQLLNNDASEQQNVLQYHVVKGEQFSWNLRDGQILHTANGHSLRIYTTVTGDNVYVNGAKIVSTDLEAMNAVIHVIDTVMDVPIGSIYAVSRGGDYPLSTFADYLDKVHLNRTLDTEGRTKYTVFAPSDEAWTNLNPLVLQHVASSSNYLRELVTYHIHPGTLHLKSLDRNGSISTLDGRHQISVSVDTDVHLNRVAMLEETDIDCDNGVIHIIDHVLIPSSIASIIG